MALSRRRLEELIDKGATIYWLSGKMVLNIHLDSSYYVSDANILCHKRSEDEKNCVEHIEYLFETEKQADWALNYTAERTDKLELPMWEEFKGEVFFNYKDIQYGLLMDNYFISIIYETPENGFSMIYKDWEPVTKENYEEACKLAIKLFKGE